MDDDRYGCPHGSRSRTTSREPSESRRPGSKKAFQQDPGDESTISVEERRLNRLTFWSVCLLDLSLSFGTGRETTFRIPSITQSLPTDEDMITHSMTGGAPRTSFPFAAKQMLSYGPLINILNGPHDEGGVWIKEAQAAIRHAVMVYNALPIDMQWSASK